MKEYEVLFDAGESVAGASPEGGHDTYAATSAMKAKAMRHLRRRLHSGPAPSPHASADDVPCCITDGLYVGGIAVARNLGALQAAGISHVVNASPIVPCFHRSWLRYHVVAVFDDEEEDIMQFFESTNSYIAKGRRKGAVLVHCFAGQSRSVALLLAYLVAHEEMTVDGALGLIRASRPAAAPNAGFMRQLQHFEASLGRGGDSPRHSLDAAAAPGCVPDSSEARGCSSSGCGGWGGPAVPRDTAPSSPRRVAAAVPFPYDDRSMLRSPTGASSLCAPSPQSSVGGRTPLAAANPVPSWGVPEFSQVTGFESPRSSPEWGPFGPPATRRNAPAPIATIVPSSWLWKDSSDAHGEHGEEPVIV